MASMSMSYLSIAVRSGLRVTTRSMAIESLSCVFIEHTVVPVALCLETIRCRIVEDRERESVRSKLCHLLSQQRRRTTPTTHVLTESLVCADLSRSDVPASRCLNQVYSELHQYSIADHIARSQISQPYYP